MIIISGIVAVEVPLQGSLRAGGREDRATSGKDKDKDPAPPAEGLADFWERWPQREMRLAAWLLVQGADGSGAWASYFASLTRVEDADAPFLWGEDERRALPSALRDVAFRQAADCAQAASDLRAAGFAFDDAEVAVKTVVVWMKV